MMRKPLATAESTFLSRFPPLRFGMCHVMSGTGGRGVGEGGGTLVCSAVPVNTNTYLLLYGRVRRVVRLS